MSDYLIYNRGLKVTIASLFLFVCLAYESGDYIYWNQRRYLTWEDFRVKRQVSKDQKHAAGTACSCMISIRPEGNLIHLQVNAVVNKAKSWVKESSRNAKILAHEQGHFDIVEINTRNFRRDIKAHTFKTATYKSELDSMTRICWAETDAEQDLYDKETAHSNNSEAQSAWLKKIELDLKASAAYADPEITFLAEGLW